MIGKTVIVYDRYLFAVPVKGIIVDVSTRDGAYKVNFFSGANVIKHNGKYFFVEQCKIEE